MGHYIENYFFRLHIHNVPNVRRTCLKKNGMELNEMLGDEPAGGAKNELFKMTLWCDATNKNVH